jgi:hypothetical protein
MTPASTGLGCLMLTLLLSGCDAFAHLIRHPEALDRPLQTMDAQQRTAYDDEARRVQVRCKPGEAVIDRGRGAFECAPRY